MDDINRRFLTIKEVCEYTGWGETKVREIVRRKDNKFTIRLGSKYYIDKNKFDAYLDNCIKYDIGV